MNKIVLWAIAAVVVIGFFGYYALYSGDGTSGTSLRESMKDFYCTASNTNEAKEVLGFAEDYDEVDKETWGFLICKQTDLNSGEYFVYFWASRNIPVTGSKMNLAEARAKSGQAENRGEPYFLIGSPFNPAGPLDYRKVEYRIYQEGGEPTAAEVYFVVRNDDRSAKEPTNLRVNWPY